MAILLVLAGGCSLDQLNPNEPTEESVLTSVDGIKALAIGLQGQFGETVNETIEVSNFLTKRYATMPSSVLGLRELETGGSDVQGFNGTVNAFWREHYRVIKSAEDLITYAPTVQLADSTRSGILALARLLKAMCLGELIEAYEQAPITVTGTGTPVFAGRTTVLATVIQLLESARDQIATLPPSVDFRNNILGNGLSLQNTINLMLARYALVSGDYAKAITAANAVDANTTSTLFYNSTNTRNPIFLITIQSVYYKPARSFRLNAETGDTNRVRFWVSPGTGNSFLGTPIDEFVQYRTDASRYYLYVPGEVSLIRAEAYARQNNLPAALTEVNAVRTKTTDAVGLGAGLPAKTLTDLPDQSSMLAEIYLQRQYELFETGLALGDSRRFNQPNASRTRNWLPYPDAERLSNPNTPADPQF